MRRDGRIRKITCSSWSAATLLEPSRIQAGDLARADRACGHEAERRRRCRRGDKRGFAEALGCAAAGAPGCERVEAWGRAAAGVRSGGCGRRRRLGKHTCWRPGDPG